MLISSGVATIDNSVSDCRHSRRDGSLIGKLGNYSSSCSETNDYCVKFCPQINRLVFVLLATLPALAGNDRSASPETIIWLNSPARIFTESSPMGNGRLGAMMFGGVDEERIVLNESSVWSGSQQDADRPGANKLLPEIRRLLIEGRNIEAEVLVNANFTC